MKKTVSAAVIMTALSIGSIASAQITPTVSDFNVKVEYSSEVDFGKATLMVLDKNGILLHMDEKKTSKDAKNSVTFDEFKFNEDLPTGDYTVKVGANGKTEDYTLNFKNPYERKNKFLAIIKSSDAEEIKLKLKDASNVIDFGYEKFLQYTGENEAFQNQICYSIAEQKFIDKYKEDKTTGQDNSEELIDEFCECMKKFYEAADIMSQSTAEETLEKISEASRLNFDKEYFDGKYMYDKKAVAAKIAQYDFKKSSDANHGLNIDLLYNIFNGETLLSVIRNNDWGVGENALSYYKKKGYTDIDYTYYNRLSSAKKEQVFSSIKSEKLSDYTKLPERFLYYSKKLAEQTESGGSGGGGSVRPGSSSKGGSWTSTFPGNENTGTNGENVKTELPFPDISEVEWAHDAISALKKTGAVGGDDDGKFNPARTITRAEFIKIIVAAFNLYDENAKADFTDVKPEDWSYSYIASSYKNGIVSGMDDNSFGKDESITREDAAVILYRIYTKNNAPIEADSLFEDNGDISDYARNAVSFMAQKKIINGYDDGKFYPKNHLTRAEGAKMIFGMLNVQ